MKYGSSMSASPYPLVEILDRVCLLYSWKVTWAGLRSLKTGCILSVIVNGGNIWAFNCTRGLFKENNCKENSMLVNLLHDHQTIEWNMKWSLKWLLLNNRRLPF